MTYYCSFISYIAPIEWLLKPMNAMWSIVIANTWIGIPFNMILLTTGLTTIPKDIYESAAIDGAHAVQRFFRITLPLLKPAMMSLLVLGFIYTFKVYELVVIMTKGGPVNATEMMSTYAYKLSFDQFHFSQGAAAANIMFLVLIDRWFCVPESCLQRRGELNGQNHEAKRASMAAQYNRHCNRCIISVSSLLVDHNLL